MFIDKKEITIPVAGQLSLKGNLNVPEGADCLVIFSHGSGSSRLSPRNNFVADELNKSHIATLLTDLLTSEEDSIDENRFNINLLTQRLIEVTNHVASMPALKDLTIGYFGASTGAASALKAAARLNEKITAVVSRGGRPDMADDELEFVKAPTLLIVGSLDEEVIELNKFAYTLLHCKKKIDIVTGASHLFEEQGKLEEVAVLARKWFAHYLKHETSLYHHHLNH